MVFVRFYGCCCMYPHSTTRYLAKCLELNFSALLETQAGISEKYRENSPLETMERRDLESILLLLCGLFKFLLACPILNYTVLHKQVYTT